MAAGDHVGHSGTWPAAPVLGSSGDSPPLRQPSRQLPGFLARMYGLSRSSNGNQCSVVEPGPASELDCLRQVFAPALLQAAEARSSELGVGADCVLIQWGVIDETAYLRYLAGHTGIRIEPLDGVARGQIPIADHSLPLV